MTGDQQSNSSEKYKLPELSALQSSLGISDHDLEQALWEIDHPQEHHAKVMERWKNHMQMILSARSEND